MPHLVLDYSEPLPEPVDLRETLVALNLALAPLGPFRLDEIKSRAVGHSGTVVGDGAVEAVFAHLTLSILSGRSPEHRRALSAGCLTVLQHHFDPVYRRHPCDLTVEVREMDRDSYGKLMNEVGRRSSGSDRA